MNRQRTVKSEIFGLVAVIGWMTLTHALIQVMSTNKDDLMPVWTSNFLALCAVLTIFVALCVLLDSIPLELWSWTTKALFCLYAALLLMSWQFEIWIRAWPDATPLNVFIVGTVLLIFVKAMMQVEKLR